MAKPKKRKVYTRKNVKSPGEGFRGQARNQSSKLRKLKDQAKTYTRESGKAKATSSPYDVTNQFNKYKKDRLKVKVKPKVKPTPKPKPKPKAKAAKNPFDKKKAPKVTKFKKPAKKSWLQKTMERGAKRGEKLNQEKAIRDFNRKVKSTRTPKGLQWKSKTKDFRMPSDDLTKKQLKVAKGTRAIQKGLGISKHAGKLKNLKGLAKGGAQVGIGIAADWGVDQLIDRGFRQLEGRSKMSLKDYRAMKDEKLKDKKAALFANKDKKAAYNAKWGKDGTGYKAYGTTSKVNSKSNKSESNKSESNKSESNKSSKGTSKKKFTMRDRMRAKNVEIHGEEAISKLEKSHKDWKAARKAGTLKTKRKKKTRPDTWRDLE